MKLFRRWLFHALALLSLLLFVGTAVLWGRSYRESDDFWWWGSRYGVGLFSTQGRILFWEGSLDRPSQASVRHLVVSPPFPFVRQPASVFYSRKFRVGFGSITKDGPLWHQLYLSHAMVLLVLIVLPVRWILVYRSGKHARAGLCCCCGYDLRATPERCPECGTIPAKVDLTLN
jgi:hypothetical protein